MSWRVKSTIFFQKLVQVNKKITANGHNRIPISLKNQFENVVSIAEIWTHISKYATSSINQIVKLWNRQFTRQSLMSSALVDIAYGLCVAYIINRLDRYTLLINYKVHTLCSEMSYRTWEQHRNMIIGISIPPFPCIFNPNVINIYRIFNVDIM